MNILFVGGGSIGHIAPSVAVLEACTEIDPNTKSHFVCSPKPDDAEFLETFHLPFTVLDAPRLGLTFPLRFLSALRASKKILDTVQPDIVFSKGGYVSLPLCYAAHKRKIPIVLHESDVVSGRANKIVSKWAKKICTGFPPSTNYQLLTTNYTGNPVRKSITQGSREEGLRISGLSGTKPILLVSGGSQGAEAINTTIENNIDDLLKIVEIIHITGRGKSANCQLPTANCYKTEFSPAHLPHFYVAADIAISRSGAGSIAEHAANTIPTILVPLRGVGHDHQYKNAIEASKNPLFTHVEQNDLDQNLIHEVQNLPQKASVTNEVSKEGEASSARQIAEIIFGCLDS